MKFGKEFLVDRHVNKPFDNRTPCPSDTVAPTSVEKYRRASQIPSARRPRWFFLSSVTRLVAEKSSLEKICSLGQGVHQLSLMASIRHTQVTQHENSRIFIALNDFFGIFIALNVFFGIFIALNDFFGIFIALNVFFSEFLSHWTMFFGIFIALTDVEIWTNSRVPPLSLWIINRRYISMYNSFYNKHFYW